MNFLAHAYLSFGNSGILAGNLAGDFFKGRAVLASLPPDICRGVILHRGIDGFADAHPAVRRAKLHFRPDYRLYAGAIVDVLFDHYLANDPKYFQNIQQLNAFSTNTYRQIDLHLSSLPESFNRIYPIMKEYDWLARSGTIGGISNALKGLERRAKHIPEIENARKIFIVAYYQLAQCYYEFIGDLVSFVRSELAV